VPHGEFSRIIEEQSFSLLAVHHKRATASLRKQVVTRTAAADVAAKSRQRVFVVPCVHRTNAEFHSATVNLQDNDGDIVADKELLSAFSLHDVHCFVSVNDKLPMVTHASITLYPLESSHAVRSVSWGTKGVFVGKIIPNGEWRGHEDEVLSPHKISASLNKTAAFCHNRVRNPTLRAERRLRRRTNGSEQFIRHLKPLQGALEAYCRRQLRNASDVEDVLQGAITKAFEDFDLFAEGTNFRAWIFKYVNFGILETNRRSRTRGHASLQSDPAVEDDWQFDVDDSLLEVLLESPEVVLEQVEDSLNHAIRELRPMDRSVLLLTAIGGFKYREIAEIVSLPMGTVMSSLHRARQQVRHELITTGREQGCFRQHQQEAKSRDDPADGRDQH